MKGGIGDMDWDISPENVKWRKELVSVMGSEEKAQELMKEHSSLVVRSTSYLARMQ